MIGFLFVNRFFPIQQNIEVSTSPVSGIVFSQLRATLTGELKCLPDATRECKEIGITLNALDANGVKNGQFSTANLKGNVMPHYATIFSHEIN